MNKQNTNRELTQLSYGSGYQIIKIPAHFIPAFKPANEL